MWNPKVEDDVSWEVKAFEQDIKGNNMETTWPPRSYTCSFCRREFRSAQALGGHMNVHRRDRAARLHDRPVVARGGSSSNAPNSQPSSSSFVSSPTFLLQLPHYYNCPTMSLGRTIDQSPLSSTFMPSMSSYPPSNLTFAPGNYPVAPSSIDSVHYYSEKTKNFPISDNNKTSFNLKNRGKFKEPSVEEGLDLDLRLGKKADAPP